jgi:hypothetical protein
MYPTFVDFLENSFGLSAVDILALAQNNPDEISRRRQEILETLKVSWEPASLGDRSDRSNQELRPIYARGLIGPEGVLSSYYHENKLHSKASREVKALLLYAHGVTVVNPVLRSFSISGDSFNARFQSDRDPSADDFVTGVRLVTELADLVRDDVVDLIDPPPFPADQGIDIQEAIAAIARDWSKLGNGMLDQWNQVHLARETLYRMLMLSGLDPLDQGGGFATSQPLAGNHLDSLLSRLSQSVLGRALSLPSAEHTRLESLFKLSMPGVDKISLKDIKDIRHDHDDVFDEFRVAMKTALSHAQESIGTSDFSTARAEVAEFMQAKANELKRRKLLVRFLDMSTSDGIKWVIGSALTSLVDWKAALLGILGTTSYEMVRSRRSKGVGALLQHYVGLSQLPAEYGKRSPVDMINSYLLEDTE